MAKRATDLAIADDRPGDELRKQRVIDAKFKIASGRRIIGPIDIDEVGNRLKRKERNSDRQYNLWRRRERRAEKCL